MLQRQLYALTTEGCEVKLFLRDQHRWIDAATIHSVESDLVTIRYQLPQEDSPTEVSIWEEMIRIDSIGSISRKVTADPKPLAIPQVKHLPVYQQPSNSLCL